MPTRFAGAPTTHSGKWEPMLLNWIYNTPLPLVVLGFCVTSIIISAIGVLVSHSLFGKEKRALHGELTNITVTNVAVLYTVLLAFIAVAAWENFVRAQEIIDSEASYAFQMFEDARGFTEPTAGTIRASIVQYLNFVTRVGLPMQEHGMMTGKGDEFLDQIRSALAEYEPPTAGKAVLMQEAIRDLNRLASARNSRLQATDGHIPEMVWIVIVVVGAITIAYSCVMRADDLLVHILMVSALAVALTLVVCLIVQLDYPFRGDISVSADAFKAALKAIGEHPAQALQPGH